MAQIRFRTGYTGRLKGRPPLDPVVALLEQARAKGVRAEWVEIETFDSFYPGCGSSFPIRMLRFQAKIGRTGAQSVVIPPSRPGTALPILRMNALPLSQLPTTA
jgi:hypothetical protein